MPFRCTHIPRGEDGICCTLHATLRSSTCQLGRAWRFARFLAICKDGRSHLLVLSARRAARGLAWGVHHIEGMETREDRTKRRQQREIHVTREGRCRFCGQWTTSTSLGHTTFDRLINDQGMCQGRPKAPYRISIGITRNGFNPNLYPLNGMERERYAEVVARLVSQVKQEKGCRAHEIVVS